MLFPCPLLLVFGTHRFLVPKVHIGSRLPWPEVGWTLSTRPLSISGLVSGAVQQASITRVRPWARVPMQATCSPLSGILRPCRSKHPVRVQLL